MPHAELANFAVQLGVTVPAVLTITLADATTDPTVSQKWAIKPEPPKISTANVDYAEGYGVDPQDRLITSAFIVDTLNAMGVSTVELTPTDQTLAGSDGNGLLYVFSHGPEAEEQVEDLDSPFVRFAMPNNAARLEDLVPIIDGDGIASAAIDLEYNDADIVSDARVLNLEGSGISSVVDEGSGKATITIPGLAGTTGFYVGAMTYEEAEHRFSIDVSTLVQEAGINTFYMAYTSSNEDISRNRTDALMMRVNVFTTYPFVDRDGNALVSSQITPGRLYEVVDTIFPPRQFRLVEDPGVRSQDYTVYAAWRPYDANDPNADWSPAHFTNIARSGSSDTGYVVGNQTRTDIDTPTVDVTHQNGIAVPDNTGDVVYTEEANSFDYGIEFFTRQAGTIDIGGVDYKVWYDNGQYVAFNQPNEYIIGQEYP